MSSNSVIQEALAQNRKNIERLLDAVGAEYELPGDPETDAKMSALFDPDGAVDKSDVELTEGERVAWLFETNAKALEAAAEAATGRAERSVVTHQSGGLDEIKAALSGGQE